MAYTPTRGGLAELVAGTDQAPSFRASTFKTPGRAGTTGQKIFALHNSTSSTVTVKLRKLAVDLVTTVVKAVTVEPPVVRLYKVTVLPTNGTSCPKVALDSTATATNAQVSCFQDASADATSSAGALTATLPATVLAGEFAARMITAAGYESADKITLIGNDNKVVLRALEGVVVVLDYTLATQNPVTDMWTVTAEWEEV